MSPRGAVLSQTISADCNTVLCDIASTKTLAVPDDSPARPSTLIIDTGLPNQEATVLDLIATLGRKPSDVVTIVNSHGHGDHIGANVALARATGATVAIHEKDAFYLEGANQKWGDTPIVTTPPDRRLSEGDVIDFGDEHLVPAHPYLPLTESVATGDGSGAPGTVAARRRGTSGEPRHGRDLGAKVASRYCQV